MDRAAAADCIVKYAHKIRDIEAWLISIYVLQNDSTNNKFINVISNAYKSVTKTLQSSFNYVH